MKKTKDTTTEMRILNAAKTIFERKGMDGARMQEIADEAGINKALLHYYFRSKQLLFEAVFKNLFFSFSPKLRHILNNSPSCFTAIELFTKNYIAFVSEHPFLPNFIIHELNRNPEFITTLISKEHFPTISKFKLQVLEEIDKGIIKPIKPEQLFANVIALCAFPFVAAPLLKAMLEFNDTTYKQFLDSRKTEIATFIINSIKA